MGVIQNYSQRKIYQNYQSRNESLTTRHFNNSLNHTQLSVYSNKQLGIGHKRPSGGRYLDDGDIKLNEEIKIELPQERDKKSLPKILNKAEDKPTCQRAVADENNFNVNRPSSDNSTARKILDPDYSIPTKGICLGFQETKRPEEFGVSRKSINLKLRLQKQGKFKYTMNKEVNGIKFLKKPEQVLENGCRYSGEWEGDIIHDGGAMIWPDGTRYDGYWRKGRPSINGRVIHSNGDVYEGEIHNNKANGYGKFSQLDGAEYSGYWKDNLQHGKGKETWPNGIQYVGDFINGMKQGTGKLTWIDGSEYQGQFSNNDLHGQGYYKWGDGRVYEGTWIQNRMHGRGVFTWKNNMKYEGDYINDLKHGIGTFTWPDGRIYIGQWKDGKQDGFGKFYQPEGLKAQENNEKSDPQAQKNELKKKNSLPFDVAAVEERNDKFQYGFWVDGKRERW